MAKEFKEKTITVNLTKAFNKPTTKRAKSALFILKNGIRKETRIDNVKISNGVNEAIWEKGLYHTPRKITVKLVTEKNDVRAYLPDEKVIVEEKKNDKKTVETKKETTQPKEETKKSEVKKETTKVEHKKETTKEEVKKETTQPKEEKKETTKKAKKE
jgi:ribosomal protein L31E